MRSFLFAVVILFSTTDLAGQSDISYKITSVEAYLYYQDRDSYSENIIDNSTFSLWNVIIGEGSAKGISEQTLIKVVVEASGNGQLNAKGLSLEVSVSSTKAVVLKKTFRLGLFNSKRRNSYLLLANDTGCLPLTVTAKLVGKGGGSHVTKTIPFECGE